MIFFLLKDAFLKRKFYYSNPFEDSFEMIPKISSDKEMMKRFQDKELIEVQVLYNFKKFRLKIEEMEKERDKKVQI